MNPIITIAIPVYNVEKYVKRSVLSALDQDYDNLEILIIDDKGTDGSIDIINDVINKHPRGHIVKIIDHMVNRGTGATKNSAIDNANGEYIYFMDSDDYMTHNAISKLYNAIGSSDVAIGSYDEFDSNDVIVNRKLQNNVRLNGECPIHQWEFSIKKSYVQTWNKLYRTYFLRNNRIRCIPSATCEDIFFTFQLYPTVKSLVCIPDITYHYNIGNQTSVMATTFNGFTSRKAHEQFIMTLKSMVEYAKANGYEHNSQMADYFWQFMLMNLSTICKSKELSKKDKIEYIKDLCSIERSIFNYNKTIKKSFINWLLFSTSPNISMTSYKLISKIQTILKEHLKIKLHYN